MADLLASFETGFERPSLENPRLFSRYADEIAKRLRQEFAEHSGYRIRVEKREDNPRRRKWTVRLHRGWFTGASVVIRPLALAPHRARVKVHWDSRLLQVMAKAFVYVSLPALLILFVMLTVLTRARLALIVTGVAGILWAIAGSILLTVVARLFAFGFGDEFNNQVRIALADKIEKFPLPKSTPSASA
jgi:hypothetical protein